jgi:hypothetical protein
MKLLFKYLLIISAYGCLSHGIAQNTAATEMAFKSDGISIPPLHIMIDSAINHNAMLRYRTLE